MVIKRVTKSKAAQRKGAISNWKVIIKIINIFHISILFLNFFLVISVWENWFYIY